MKHTYKQQFDLSGKVAVVTGGIGILGKLFCAGLAEFGASVAVLDLDDHKAKEYAKYLNQNYGVACVGTGCDVSDPESIRLTCDKIENQIGPINILHNNAATKGEDLTKFFAPVGKISLKSWREIMSVNLDGMFFMAQDVGSRMAKQGGGAIIQTASIYGVLGPDQRIYEDSQYLNQSINTPPVYSASKAGVIGLTQYLATYWAKSGVRVNSLTPGGVESGQNEEFKKKYSDRVPMHRMAEAKEMVAPLIFLASDASSYVTGQNLCIDGGMSSW